MKKHDYKFFDNYFISFLPLENIMPIRNKNVKKPNIVILFADDLGYGDLGCYGATKIPTPNVDSLAKKGLKFMDVHSSSAVCTPSRYSLLTGRYCWRTELKKWVIGGYGAPLIPRERPTIASFLGDNGYRTAAIGKWHLGLWWPLKEGVKGPEAYNINRLGFELDCDYSKPIKGGPNELGFNYFFGIAGSLDMHPYCYIENDHTVGIPDHYKEVLCNQQRKGLTTDNWKDEEVDIKCTEKSIAFIEDHLENHSDKPFFLYHATAAPHRPCEVRPDFVINKSQAGDRGDMVVLFDWVVGQIKDTLEKHDLMQNTLLIITSDNGARLQCANGKTYGHKSCGELKGQKADIWEGGHREPFIIIWPSVLKPNTTCHQLMCLSDLFASISGIFGKELPDNAAEDSFDLSSIFLGEQNENKIRDTIIHHSGGGIFSIRQGKWKLIQGLGSGGFSRPRKRKSYFWRPKGQLYDLEKDFKETNNLWKERPDIVKKLTDLLEKQIEQGFTREKKNK
ncbi:MAG: sulfatase-like hydrolase/transferase [Candidatus Lokiarchaeota archaeon]|nr:sulfatase-like hydrolase/transferase [Candidatus Lokiarchaeota archaeon]